MIKPYYQANNVILYCGDYEEILPELEKDCADLIITDPPYGQSYKGTKHRKKQLDLMEIKNDNGEFNINNFLNLIKDPLRNSRHAYIFGPYIDQVNAHKYFGGTTELIWDKDSLGGGDLNNLYSKSYESITFTVNLKRCPGDKIKGDGNIAGRLRKKSVMRYARLNASANANHLTEKPINLLREFVESSSHIGETVLDPCAGSGSTLLAAIFEGRKAIGVEIEEKLCETITARIEKYSYLLKTLDQLKDNNYKYK